ncbi:minor capsid protein [Acaricomes phytoseiuli]|uniref:minor capsid protein n=1 Tax=Acaricomes phytoseiuli TaxID=291968 RepID=UPI00035E9533|nr:minor capsid protein [Acaricomes phytoseiuli]
MSFQTTLLTAIGELLEAEQIGQWKPSDTYSRNRTAITVLSLPQATDRAITMNLYPVQDDATTDSIVGLQFRIRGAPNDPHNALNTIDAIFNALHDLRNTSLANIPVVRMWRQSGANLGKDEKDRPEHTENYYIQLTRTGKHRSDN